LSLSRPSKGSLRDSHSLQNFLRYLRVHGLWANTPESATLGQRSARMGELSGRISKCSIPKFQKRIFQWIAEYGLVAPRSLIALRKTIPLWLEDASNGLTIQFRKLLHGLWGDLRSLDERMKELDHQIAIIAQENPTAKRLQQVPGIGPLIATALVGTMGSGTQYRKGRDMAAAVGLTPRQHSSGGKQR